MAFSKLPHIKNESSNKRNYGLVLAPIQNFKYFSNILQQLPDNESLKSVKFAGDFGDGKFSDAHNTNTLYE